MLTISSGATISRPSGATVAADGSVAGLTSGDTAIVITYQRRITTTPVIVSHSHSSPPYESPPTTNLVDRYVNHKLGRLKLVPSQISNDDTFLRRITLDVIGSIPTPEEVIAFRENDDPSKRFLGMHRDE